MKSVNQIPVNIRKRVLSDPLNRWIFNQPINGVYLVGGYVRDLIINRKPADRDFVVGGHIDTFSRDLARQCKGKVIHISRYNIRRVITHKREVIDITPLGLNINSNLRKRDFTINAIAWSSTDGLVDPLGGVSDIKNSVLRVTHKKSLHDDPLRCLRAFRIAAELKFNIYNETLALCKKNAGKLQTVAKERITDEFIKLLSIHNVTHYIKSAFKHKVLSEILSLNSLILINNITILHNADQFIARIRSRHSDLYNSLQLNTLFNEQYNQGVNGYCLINIALLTYNDSGKRIFDKRLSLSNDIEKRINSIHHALRLSGRRLTKKALYEIFTEAGSSSEEAGLIISMLRNDISLKYLIMSRDLKRFKMKNVITGNDIQNELNIDKGEQVGRIKEEICRKWFMGKLRTKKQFMSYIRSNLT